MRIGLISDTHCPERCPCYPASLGSAFRDVDLILHAGDADRLWVLDALSELAPVVAVHGNDDTTEAQSELPFKQIIAVNGKRIYSGMDTKRIQRKSTYLDKTTTGGRNSRTERA